MKRVLAGFFLVAAAALVYAPAALTQGGSTVLFDGKNLDNFNKIGDANWRIEDGTAVADKGNGFLVTKDSYGDFQLRVEFWSGPDANSGVFIRSTDPQKITATNAYAAMTGPMTPGRKRSGGLLMSIVSSTSVAPKPNR